MQPELTGCKIKFSVRLKVDPVFFQEIRTPTKFKTSFFIIFVLNRQFYKSLSQQEHQRNDNLQ